MMFAIPIRIPIPSEDSEVTSLQYPHYLTCSQLCSERDKLSVIALDSGSRFDIDSRAVE